MIGVNSAIFSPTGGSVGVGFAIPAETVKTIADRLREKGAVSRGWIGVEVQSVNEEIAEGLGLNKPGGVLVAETVPDSPAVKAGIAPGDVITSVADRTPPDPSEPGEVDHPHAGRASRRARRGSIGCRNSSVRAGW